jgi:CBS domain-containing protein
MARVVQEIMNAELFSLRSNDDASQAVDYVLALGITAAPVLDEEGKPVGVASLRDLLRHSAAGKVADRMTVPALTVGAHEPIETAARRLAEHDVHHLVVVDAKGRAVGMVASVDFVRALLGLPSLHPDAFPHWDKLNRVSWSDDTLLDLEHVDVAPDTAGVFALVSGGRGKPERVVWAEPSNNVRTRLYELLSGAAGEAPELRRILEQYTGLRFRSTALPAPRERDRLARALMAEAHAALTPRHAE